MIETITKWCWRRWGIRNGDYVKFERVPISMFDTALQEHYCKVVDKGTHGDSYFCQLETGEKLHIHSDHFARKITEKEFRRETIKCVLKN
jgi:hypothetical protein